MGTEDWVFKGTKLKTNTKKQRSKKIDWRLDFQKYHIKEKKKKKKKQSHKNYLKNRYMKFSLKIGSFFEK